MKNYTLLLVALLFTINLQAQIIDIPDADFKYELVNEGCASLDGMNTTDVDTNDDGEISVAEAEAVLYLTIDDNEFSSLVGIEYFTNMTRFICNYNYNLTEVDFPNLPNLTTVFIGANSISSLNISGLTNLYYLTCGSNFLTGLDTSANSNLANLQCRSNLITSLDMSNNGNLISLNCNNNLLNDLDLSSNSNLETLSCENNALNSLNVNPSSLEYLNYSNTTLSNYDISDFTELLSLKCKDNLITDLDISQNVLLNNLDCSNNQISTLDLNNINLYGLYCSNNLLTSLDISNTSIVNLSCSNNQLINLNLKNGRLNWDGYIYAPTDPNTLQFQNNPDLVYICSDNEIFYDYYNELDFVQNLVNIYGYTNCQVNSYCSFVPGGDFYTIQGTTLFDIDDNGCDISDPEFIHLNFSITNGTETGSFISNSSGNYLIPVQEGDHTITPVLENPSYFSVSPSSLTVDFPTDSSPFIQDFCISPNGTHHDLEIIIIPLEQARPGFDTNYRVLYKNKGNTTLSGNINFGFEDDVMDFVSSSPPNESGVPDLLQWSFTDLEPFESRTIDLTMNLNAPTDTPPLNDADILTFITSIATTETDETPEDNTFELHQTVVNSFDPNDKTCLEGDFITPEMVGEFVHYMIRFENTGSAEAINIVVKDHIDITRYDLSTLIPLHASHDYVARIKDEGSLHYVEFIFEDINLPFDDANNDGYISFKIKTLDTLVLNDTFENEAEIYFDFNFPIITNTAMTTIGSLSTDEFEFADSNISLYPNPASDTIHISSKNNIENVNIYNISGRIIKQISVEVNQTNFEISTESLSSGTYFIKLIGNQSDVIKKLIKK